MKFCLRYLTGVLLVMMMTPALADGFINGASKGVAIDGYDPVAYFTDGESQKGSSEFTTDWGGTQWRFSSAEHRDLFVQMPGKYAPQYGGYCAYAASINLIAPGNPTHWKVVDGKLFLNNNLIVHKLWERDIPAKISAGDQHWPSLKSRIEGGEK